jgi:antitoxin ParD1/3/4
MTTVRKTITLTDTQNDWIKAQIDSGAYTNDSEVLRDLIRKAQHETAVKRLANNSVQVRVA